LDGPGLYDDLTVDENIKFWSELYEVSQIRGEALLNQWGLYENKGSLVKELSAGMKQKLAISRAFLHDPSIVLMDEPTSNLDPVARKNMVEFLKSLHDKEKTLLITSHDLFDIERICSRIILLRRGQIVVTGNMEELKEALGVRMGVTIKVSNKIPKNIVNEISKDSEVNIIGEKELMLSGDKISPSSVVRYLVNKGIDVERVEEEKVTLEDIYTYIVKEDEE
jgi:ABC-2 type transport system ATP-binding protein